MTSSRGGLVLARRLLGEPHNILDHSEQQSRIRTVHLSFYTLDGGSERLRPFVRPAMLRARLAERLTGRSTDDSVNRR
eukprot:8006379-Pyramimonas_sp.AAC.1